MPRRSSSVDVENLDNQMTDVGSDKKRSRGDEDDSDDDEHETTGMISTQVVDMTQDILPVKAQERANLLSMTEEKREKAISDLTRLILFKALAQDPIIRTKCIAEAGLAEYKISTAVFDEAAIRLDHVFGFKLKRIPTWMSKVKGLPAKCQQDVYYLINTVEDEGGKHSKAIHGVHDHVAVEKGLLMVILGLTYCKGQPKNDGSRWILDKDLFDLLHRLDENIPSEPPANGSKKKRMTQSSQYDLKEDGLSTPDVDASLVEFVKREYLLKAKATPDQVSAEPARVDEDSVYYTLGPRAAVEIGRKQVIYFCAEILGVEPDPSMLDEVEQGDEEDDGY